MLEKYLDKLLKNENYSFSDMKIRYIREDDNFYVIYFDEKVKSNCRSLSYRINKTSGEGEAIFLPDVESFKFLKKFEDCSFVNIPEKYKGKYL